MIENEDILISASDVRALYQELKPRVVKLAKYYLESKDKNK